MIRSLLTALMLTTGAWAAQDPLRLLPAQGVVQGESLRVELHGGIENLGHWGRAEDSVRWTVAIPAAGGWLVQAEVATPEGPTPLRIRIDDAATTATVPRTGGWQEYRTITLGTVPIGTPRTVTVIAEAADGATWRPVNLRAVILRRQL